MDRVSDHHLAGMNVPFHQYGTDFGLIDFMDETVFDRYIDQQHQEEAIFSSNIYNNQYDHFQHHDNNINIGVANDHVDAHFYPPPPPTAMGLFDFDVNPNLNTDFGLLDSGMLCQNEAAADEEGQLLMGEEEEEEEEAWSGSGSGSGGTTANKKSDGKSDRSRTLISERKRRSRMKEKLYALRSLVPNITKMDKASIVGDAVLYVQNMKMQANKLKADIATLESSLNNGSAGEKHQDRRNPTKTYPSTFNLKIFKMDVSQVEERGFYVRIVSKKGKGVAMLLYRALESLTTFNIHNSNLAASADNYVFTFTLHTMPGEMDINLENMKLWMVSVFLNQGFEFQT